jgi:hypothetical protein
MAEQMSMDLKNFDEMEKRLLDQVMEVSKSILETFKFKMIYDSKVTSEQKKKTLVNLREFEEKNWDKTISRKEAYEKYANLY